MIDTLTNTLTNDNIGYIIWQSSQFNIIIQVPESDWLRITNFEKYTTLVPGVVVSFYPVTTPSEINPKSWIELGYTCLANWKS